MLLYRGLYKQLVLSNYSLSQSIKGGLSMVRCVDVRKACSIVSMRHDGSAGRFNSRLGRCA